MLWLEMSRDEAHGGGSWGFGRCLWSPSHKTNGARWAYWDTVLRVTAGDSVLHLRGKGDEAAFVGLSTAAADGAETVERPPEPGDWGDAPGFFRVPLEDFRPLTPSVSLRNVFADRDAELREYFARNKSIAPKRRLFYVVQAGRLQCLNGAYLSEVSEELLRLLLGHPGYPPLPRPSAVREVKVGEQLRELLMRVGQEEFSDNVRRNYGGRCCFPGCDVAEPGFLRGAHIARWADAPALRGSVANGLCLCLMHDAAFERGLFTLDLEARVWVHPARLHRSDWAVTHLQPYHGQTIRLGAVLPSHEALLQHWERVGCYPG